MMVPIILSLIVIVAVTLLIRRRKPQKSIYEINFTVNDNKGLPAKKVYVVNYVHNKDKIPVRNQATIRNCVI